MLKKVITWVFITLGIGVFFIICFFLLLSSVSNFNYGHHFAFENELGIKIDSLEITIGDKSNLLTPWDDGRFSGNLSVPEEGYPHKVTLHVFSNSNVIKLPADSFNCYNCDGDHEYILKEPQAEYIFHF